jgi:hypothetical protein
MIGGGERKYGDILQRRRLGERGVDFSVAGQLSLHLRQFALQAVLDIHNVDVVFFVTHTNDFTVLTIGTEVSRLENGHPPRSSLTL